MGQKWGEREIELGGEESGSRECEIESRGREREKREWRERQREQVGLERVG